MKELSENEISLLVTPELFATYIGKTPSAIRKWLLLISCQLYA